MEQGGELLVCRLKQQFLEVVAPVTLDNQNWAAFNQAWEFIRKPEIVPPALFSLHHYNWIGVVPQKALVFGKSVYQAVNILRAIVYLDYSSEFNLA